MTKRYITSATFSPASFETVIEYHNSKAASELSRFQIEDLEKRHTQSNGATFAQQMDSSVPVLGKPCTRIESGLFYPPPPSHCQYKHKD